MRKRKTRHLLLEDVYKEYGIEPGTEVILMCPENKFKITPTLIEIEGEFEYYFLVRAYFGEESNLTKERSYLTTIDKFDVYNEDVYICRNYKEESIYV